ncbi:VOC family protein [Sphingomonas sp. LM7]|uniref:VOC family protein n=1 Tax=Sphingomonas sp. LM7 TaxID=1938607 RepID=UPI000983B0E1|nr:VOC family protein [Sphingomonas sp. LM7]AQR73734.1 glyoxalase [Sphingomonas sp. LM7]
MFSDVSSSAIVAVKDLARARAFYANTLRLALASEDDQVLTFRTGATTLAVYVSDAAGTNKANAAVWSAGADFDAVVAQLKMNGVTFEEYPVLGMQVSDGIHTAGDFKAAWFKDPDGNILHINSM